MNKNNIEKLIKAIEDNKRRFNMNAFIATAYDNLYGDMCITEQSVINEDINMWELNTDPRIDWKSGDKFFDSCDTVGCIAGFASAIANDWTVPQGIKPEITWYVNQANDYLGLTIQEGKNLYFADGYSVWKLLNHEQRNNDYCCNIYGSLQYDPDCLNYEDDYADYNYPDDWSDPDLSIDFKTISPDMAIDLLKKLVSGEIVLDDEDGYPYINRSYILVSS